MYEWTERYSLQPWQSLFPCKAHIFITSLKWRKWTKYKQVRWEDSKGGLLLNPKPEEEIAPGADLAGGCVCVSLHGHCKSVFSLSLAFCSKMGQDTGAGCLSRNWETAKSQTHTHKHVHRKNNPPHLNSLICTVFLLAKFRHIFLVNKCILLSAPFKNYTPCLMPNNLFKY